MEENWGHFTDLLSYLCLPSSAVTSQSLREEVAGSNKLFGSCLELPENTVQFYLSTWETYSVSNKPKMAQSAIYIPS